MLPVLNDKLINKKFTNLSLVLGFVFFAEINAFADLGNCRVFFDPESKIGYASREIIHQYVHRNYELSDDSDADLLFKCIMHGESSVGTYTIKETRPTATDLKAIGVKWSPSVYYEINASDLEGIMNGVYEIAQALKAGRSQVFNLDSGIRESSRKAPLLKEKYLEKMQKKSFKELRVK